MGSPEAVAAIEKAASDKAAADERARLTGLSAAFGNDAEFLAKAVSEGMSVNDAKAAKFDAVVAENTALKADVAKLTEANADLKKRVESTKVPFGGASDDAEKPEANSLEARIEARIEAAWNNKASGAQANFAGVKEAFSALMKSSPEKLAKYEKKSS